MPKSYGWGGGMGGPCDFSVSPSPFGLDFGTLDFGLGLDNIREDEVKCGNQFIYLGTHLVNLQSLHIP